jgi:O-succinylbenzoic acid--CoA ligase
MMLRAYRNGQPPIDSRGFLHTDDLGHWLPDGRLSVQGRRGDLIITGGENVWPEIVEATLALHPGVEEVGVVGVDDAQWGQAVAAWVVPSDPANPPSLDDLRGFAREHIAAFMAPRSLSIVSQLPRTNIGKLQRSRLRSLHASAQRTQAHES